MRSRWHSVWHLALCQRFVPLVVFCCDGLKSCNDAPGMSQKRLSIIASRRVSVRVFIRPLNIQGAVHVDAASYAMRPDCKAMRWADVDHRLRGSSGKGRVCDRLTIAMGSKSGGGGLDDEAHRR